MLQPSRLSTLKSNAFFWIIVKINITISYPRVPNNDDDNQQTWMKLIPKEKVFFGQRTTRKVPLTKNEVPLTIGQRNRWSVQTYVGMYLLWY